MIYNLFVQLERDRADKFYTSLCKNEHIIELKKHVPKHSDPQRRYFHSLLKLFAIHYGDEINEVLNVDDIKEHVRRSCPITIVSRGIIDIYRSTADLDSQEYGLMIEWFRNWSAKEPVGIYLPSPEEWRENEHEILEFIRVNSKWI